MYLGDTMSVLDGVAGYGSGSASTGDGSLEEFDDVNRVSCDGFGSGGASDGNGSAGDHQSSN